MDVIDVSKKVLSFNRELEITNEAIVPDVKPDIVSIITSSGLAYCYKQEQANSSIKLDGSAEITVAYLSSEGDTRSMQIVLDFTDKLENSEIKENSILKYNIRISNINTKMLNERKLSVECKIIIEYNIYEKNEIKFYNEFNNIEGLQKREENLVINALVGVNSSKAVLKESIKVDSVDIIAEILKSDIKITNIESKISYNKVLAKAEVKICIIYLTEDSRISKVEVSFPVMSFIEIANVKEENICDLDYKIRNLLLKVNTSEEHSILCQIDFEIMCQVFEKKNINIVSDLYSLKGDVKYIQNEVELELNGKEEEKVNIEEKIEIDNLKRVLAIDSDVNLINNTDSEVNLKIYYEVNDKNGLNVKDIKIPFMKKNIEASIAEVKNSEYDVDSNYIIIKMELGIKSSNNLSKKIPIIENVELIDILNKEDYSVVVYFVKPNDTIWKIAKKFKVTIDSIIKINNLENPDLIYPGDKLYVLK